VHVTTEPPAGKRSFPWQALVAAVIGVAFIAVALPGLWIRSPLGHDEAVYALRSRDLLQGWSYMSGDYWADFRAPGLPLILSGVGRVIGIHVTTARLVVVLLGIVIVLATAYIGRRIGNTTTGLLAAAFLLVTSGFVLTSTTLLADTPGAAFALIAVAVFANEADHGRLRWALGVVPLAAFASTLSRFGAPFMLGAGLLGVAVITAPRVVRERNVVLVVQSAVVAVVVGAVVWLVVLTDTFSLYSRSPAQANRQLVDRNGFTFSTGFADLRRVINPWSDAPVHMWSRPVVTIFAVGVLAALVSLAFDRSRRRVVVFALVAGLISLFAVLATVGLVVTNYLTLTVPYCAILVAAGWDWLVRLLLQHSPGDAVVVRRVVIVLAGVAVVTLAFDAATDVRDVHRRYAYSNSNIALASVTTGERLGDECVLISRYTPQAGYYSECRTVRHLEWQLAPQDSLAASVGFVVDRWDLGVPPTAPVAAMLVEQANRQPDLTALSELDDLFGERVAEVGQPGERRRHIIVDMVEPCVADSSCPSFSDD
jgi:4-amino-4-deoxy-L-arabinose transferase-like glycosyltransferase